MIILGVDIGGVIIRQIGGKTSGTSFVRQNFLATPPVPGVFDCLAELVAEKFGDNVDVVSKCGVDTEALSIKWLAEHNFYKRTGISPKRVFFRRDRASKAACVAERRHTHFIDNHPGVLGLMDTVRYRTLQGATKDDMKKDAGQLSKFFAITQSWPETVSALLKA